MTANHIRVARTRDVQHSLGRPRHMTNVRRSPSLGSHLVPSFRLGQFPACLLALDASYTRMDILQPHFSLMGERGRDWNEKSENNIAVSFGG
jgi:hypothetical protein